MKSEVPSASDGSTTPAAEKPQAAPQPHAAKDNLAKTATTARDDLAQPAGATKDSLAQTRTGNETALPGAEPAETKATAPSSPTTAPTADAGKESAAKDPTGKDPTGKDPTGKAAAPTAAAAGATRRFRPLAALGRGGRATATWARGPVGRVVLPGFVVTGLVVLAGTSGAYLVPRALEAAAPTATPTFTDQSAAPSAGWSDPAAPGGPTIPGGAPGATTGAAPPTGTLPATGLPTAAPTATGARPADALASWAQQVGTRVGIPVVAVQAYGYAELVTAKTTPSCHLSWTTLAAIGKIESGHGSHDGAVLGADGVTTPSIRGLPLDGQGGRQMIRDTDRGTLDGDTTYDRAVGPMQFIPATWQATAVDADNNGVKDPNDIDDAALTAAAYLCKGGRDMARADSWWDAVLTYNDVRQYARDVFTAANDYGVRSRT